MCTYPSDTNNVLHCKNILLAWLMTLTPTLKYTILNYYKNCVFRGGLVFEWWISRLNYFCLMLEWENNCHLFMYSQKRSLWDCVIKLPDNRIFKALLWIKNSFKFINFDLAKHTLVSLPILALVELIWIDLGVMK